MIYRAIGLVSDSTTNGLQIGYIEFLESGGKWSYELLNSHFISYYDDWQDELNNSSQLSAKDYFLLDHKYSIWLANIINEFIEEHQLHFKIALLSVHGYEAIKIDERKIISYLGDGAVIAAKTQIPVITNLLVTTMALDGVGELSATQAFFLLPSLRDDPHQSIVAVALLGILRWREEITAMKEATGAIRESSGGAMWLG